MDPPLPAVAAPLVVPPGAGTAVALVAGEVSGVAEELGDTAPPVGLPGQPECMVAAALDSRASAVARRNSRLPQW